MEQIDEIRYAIIIGINDYETKPLRYCVNDAQEIKESIEKHCLFKRENIFLITSDKDNSIADVHLEYFSTIRNLRDRVREKKDSILFYFAGHGFSEKLLFKKHTEEISSIIKDIQGLKPRFISVIIDACESGSFRSRLNSSEYNPQLIANLTNNCEGGLYFFACEKNEEANESFDYEHGNFTKHILDALKNEQLYEPRGFISPEKLKEEVTILTAQEANYTQNPIANVFSKGAYPFAVHEKILSKTPLDNVRLIYSGVNTESQEPIIPSSEIDNSMKLSLNEEQDYDFTMFFRKAENIFENQAFQNLLRDEISNDKYRIKSAKDFTCYPNYVVSQLEEQIVQKSKQKGLMPTEASMTERISEDTTPWASMMTDFSMFLKSSEQKRKVYSIRFWEGEVASYNVFLESKVKERPSAGLGFVLFRCLYGMGLVIYQFKLEYDGESNSNFAAFQGVYDKYKFESIDISKVIARADAFSIKFKAQLNEWEKIRAKEIEDFFKDAN